jgi:hypothetical protein
MPNEDAYPAIFFIVSAYAFGVALLYSLARAWEKTLSTRSERNDMPSSMKGLPRRTPASAQWPQVSDEMLGANVRSSDEPKKERKQHHLKVSLFDELG